MIKLGWNSKINLEEGINNALERYRNAEIFFSTINLEKERKIFEREKSRGDYDQDEEFESEEYEFDSEFSYLSLDYNAKAKTLDIINLEKRLNIKLPTSLIEFYSEFGNGVGGGEQLEFLSTSKIIGLVDFLNDFISEGMPYDIFKVKGSVKLGNGKALSKNEQILVNSINENYFVYAVSWHDYQRIELLIFDKNNQSCGIQFDIHDDQHVFEDYLKNFKDTTRMYPKIKPFVNRYLDYLISEMIASDFEADEILKRLF